jgi:hypothetical protein
MIVRHRLVLVFALCAGLVVATSARPRAVARADQGKERQVLITVLDANDRPIRDLKASEFLVREDNQNREVTHAELTTEPLFVVLLVDTTKPPMGITPPTQDLRSGLAQFVATVTAASPDAEIALMEYGGAAVMTVNFARTTDDLDKAIQRMLPSQRSSGVLLEGLVEAGKALSKRASPRRAIVATNFSWTESSALVPKAVADSVIKSGATVWAVTFQGATSSSNFQIGSQSVDNEMNANREIVLNNLPPMTGGLRLTGVTPTALGSMLEKVAQALTSQYVVTYVRPDGPPAKVVQATATRGARALTAPWGR